MYNDLIFVRNRVQRAWSNIGVSLKKRANLIPNLVKIAKEYLKHEKELHTQLSKLRKSARSAADFDPAAAGLFISQEVAVMQKFFGLEEKYPDLKGNQMMAQLHKKLVLLENEVASCGRVTMTASNVTTLVLPKFPSCFWPIFLSSKTQNCFMLKLRWSKASSAQPTPSPRKICHPSLRTMRANRISRR
ncbi:MAG: hypothetical protein Ct9H300mP7_3680 [Verrucomicrobiota bacterium]|nr:MAG: hypothetical protein Ct9H300mP7_3680 [Verrucomicrobiota bacterium]